MTPLPKMKIDASELGGVNLYCTEILFDDGVGIQAKSQFLVEALGAIDVRDRYDQDSRVSYP